MPSPLYNDDTLAYSAAHPELTAFGQPVTPTATDQAAAPKPYDGVSQPGDDNFDWSHYEDFLKTHHGGAAGLVDEAKQTLTKTQPTADLFSKIDDLSARPDNSQPSAGTAFGHRLKPEAEAELSGVHDVGAADAALMAPGLSELAGAAKSALGPPLVKAGSAALGGYEGYKYGGIPGAIAGLVGGWKTPGLLESGKLGRIGKLLGSLTNQGATSKVESDMAEGFDPHMPNVSNIANRARVSTEVPYASSTGNVTPAGGWGRTSPAHATAEADNLLNHSSYSNGHVFPEPLPTERLDANEIGGGGYGSTVATVYPGANDEPLIAHLPADFSHEAGNIDMPPSAGLTTRTNPLSRLEQATQGLSASPATATAAVPSTPPKVVWGPGATTKEGLPAQADIGNKANLLYDPQTPTSYIRTQYGLTTDPAEKEFLARVLRQRDNVRNTQFSPLRVAAQ